MEAQHKADLARLAQEMNSAHSRWKDEKVRQMRAMYMLNSHDIDHLRVLREGMEAAQNRHNSLYNELNGI